MTITMERALTCADLTFDAATRQIARSGVATRLTAAESRLLHLLMRHPGEPVARPAILRELWGDTPPCASSLSMLVLALRRKTETGGGSRLVHTAQGVGYLLASSPFEPWHGTPGGYSNRKCRCRACRDANAAAVSVARERRAKTPFELIPHGENGYGNYGCRCPRCKAGHAARMRRVRAGDPQ
jgi:DNA-binding winged helix-turn-helix (wHTH) protein